MPRLLAAVYDPLLKGAEDAGLRAWRGELLAGLAGEVLELGAGTGLNLPHYTPAVSRLVLCEPDRHMRVRLERKLRDPADRAGAAAIRDRVEVTDARAEALPFQDRSFDAVVATLVLCSVADPARALAEIRRVLREGGRFLFLEHVASDDPKVFRWQRRLEPLWKRLAGNCHLSRRTGEAIAAAGFRIESLTAAAIPKSTAIDRPGIRGVARKPAGR